MTERYEITSQLGEDILGAVYLADDTMLKRRVMCRHIEYGDHPDVKDRDESWKKDFTAHTGKLGAMQHPNMMTIYDVNVDDSGAFVFSQLIEGNSLADRLESGALRQDGVYRMAADMLEALHAAHESGVYHGALHTGSIKRVNKASGGYRYLLVDLGLNQLASMVKAEKIQVADPVLMAPELHEVDKDPDAKSDLFMLGQLCYTALVGGHPFSDKSSKECLEAYQVDGMPGIDQYVEGLNPEFVEWVMRMIEVDPENRPADTAEAIVGLYAIELDEAEPNVPGQAYAVQESVSAISAAPQLVATSQQVAITAATDSVDNTAATNHLEMTQAQAINGAMESENKEKKVMIYIISGLVVALLIGGIVAAFRSGEKNVTVATKETTETRKHSIQIEEELLVNSVVQQNKPLVIDLDSGNYLDWMIGVENPISSKHVSKESGRYIHSVDTIFGGSGYRLRQNPVRFRSSGEVLFPQAAIFKGPQGPRGAGYEIQLRIPAEEESSITVKLYILQKGTDLNVEVTSPRGDSREVAVVPFTKQYVVMIPIKIDNPTPGDFYTFKVTSGAGDKKSYMMGLSGVLIEKR